MMNAGLPLLATRGLTVDPRNADKIVIAVGDQWNKAQGLFASDNGGETWKKVLPDVYFYGNEDYRWAGTILARDPKNPDTIYAGSGGMGVYRSTDNGKTWTNIGAEGVFVTDLEFGANGELMLCAHPVSLWRDGKAGTQVAGGLFVLETQTKGATWRKLADNSPNEVVPLPQKPGQWAGLFPDKPNGYVFVSRDGGASWQAWSEGLPKPTDNGNASDTRFDAIGTGRDFLVVGSGKGTFYRRNINDAAWQKVERQSVIENYEGEPWYGAMGPGKYQHFGSAMASVVVNPTNPNHWIFTDWYALYQSYDAGKNWNLSMDGVEVTVLHTLTQDPKDPGVVHLGMADNGYLRSENGGERFITPHVMSNAKSIAVCPSEPSRIYVAGDAGNGQWRASQVWVSVDRGKSWNRSPMEGLPDMANHSCNSIAVSPTNPYEAYLALSGKVEKGKGGIYKSVDGGKSWAWLGDGLPGEELFHHEIWGYFREIAIGPGGYCVAVSMDKSRVFLLIPGGSKWQEVKVPSKAGEPHTVVADPHVMGRFVIAYGDGGVWVSDDTGQTWQQSLKEGTNSVAADSAKSGRWVAGSRGGVRVSENGGKTWRVLNTRLPYPEPPVVAIAGERVIAGTAGSGAFWMALSPAGEKPVQAKPAKVAEVPGYNALLPVVNGDMEQGTAAPSEWSIGYTGEGKLQLTRDTTDKHGGAASLRFSSVGGKAAGSTGQTRVLQEGIALPVEVKFAGWCKASTGVSEALIAVQSFDKDGKQVGWTTLFDAKAAQNWTKWEGTANLPKNAVRANIVVTLNGNGSVWLDDMEAVRGANVFLNTPK